MKIFIDLFGDFLNCKTVEHIMAQLETSETPEGKQNDDNDKANEDGGIDLKPDKDYPWYVYTYNAKNMYFIHIQWKMAGQGQHPWRKHGVRRCTINGKSAKLISFKSRPHKFDNMCEYLKLSQDGKEYRLYNNKQIGWCFDNGDGVFFGIKTQNNGKMEEM